MRLAAIIEAPAECLPNYQSSDGDARPHIEVHGSSLSWVVQERGSEFERRTTSEREELLYWTFVGVTGCMAGDWELQHRVPYTEPRILMFAWQLALLARIDPAWRERQRQEQVRLLREHPHRSPPPLGPSELRDLRAFLERGSHGVTAREAVMLERISATLDEGGPLTPGQRNFMITGLAARGLEVNGLSYQSARELLEQGVSAIDQFDGDPASADRRAGQ